jgi:hypothetical protein
MKELLCVVHMDLNVFGVLVLNWIVDNGGETFIVHCHPHKIVNLVYHHSR